MCSWFWPGLKFRVGELSDVSEVMGEDVMQLRKLLQTGKEVLMVGMT